MAAGNQVPTPVAQVGDGYNIFTGSAMPCCLNNITPEKGATSELANVYICQSATDLYKALEINAEMALESSWGAFQSKLQFISQLSVKTLTIVILVRAARVISTKTASGSQPQFVTLPSDSPTLLSQSGNSYLSSLSLGGEFIAAYSYTAYDETSYSQLVSTSTTSFGRAAWKFDASFDASISSLNSITNVTQEFSQVGLGFSSTPLPTPDQFSKFVLEFSEVTLDGPEVIEFSTLSYSGIPAAPPDFYQVDNYSALYAPLDEQTIGYAGNATLAAQRKAIIQSVSDFYAQYNYSDPQLATVATALQKDIKAVADWVTAVLANPTGGSLTVTFNGVPMGWPVQQYGISIATSFGGLEGDAFSDIGSDDIAQGCRFLGFGIWGDAWVDALMGQYQIGDQQLKKNHGDFHGSGSVHQLGPGEYVTSITVYMARYAFISQIQISTNIYWIDAFPPSPLKEEGPHTWSTPTGQTFVGFSGASGDSLNKLAPIYFQGLPAKWFDATTPSLVLPN